jgi:hypothetical protein
MKQIILSLTLVFAFSPLFSQVNSSYRIQNGYYKPSTGTYVMPHFKTTTNNTNWDNYSTTPNYNPWNGNSGYRARDYSTDAYNYGSGRTIYEGSRGGQYYYNDRGNKVYVPKRSNW